MKKASTAAIWAALITVYILWGSTYLAIRYAVTTLPPFLMASGRFFIAGGVLYAFRRWRGDPAPTRREWRGTIIAGFFLLTLGNGGVVWAEQRVPSGVAALLIGATPLWFVLLDWLRPGGQWPGWRAFAGVAVGFAGIALLINPVDLASSARIDLLGALAVSGASAAWAAGSLYSRQAIVPSSPLLGTSMEMLSGAVGLLLLGTLAGDWGHFVPAAVSTASLMGVGWLIVFGSLVAFSAYVWLLRSAPIPLVATYAYVNPVVAIFLGALIGGEPLTTRTLIAAAVIISSVIVTNLARRGAPRPAEPQPAAAASDC